MEEQRISLLLISVTAEVFDEFNLSAINQVSFCLTGSSRGSG